MGHYFGVVFWRAWVSSRADVEVTGGVPRGMKVFMVHEGRCCLPGGELWLLLILEG